eukprot:tig00020528_g9980.t1
MDPTNFGDAPRRRAATNSILHELTDVAAVNANASAERDALNSLSHTEAPTLIDCGGGIYITSPGNPLTPQGVVAWRDDAKRAIDSDTKRYSDADDGSKLAFAAATMATKAIPLQYQTSTHDMIEFTHAHIRKLAKLKEELREASEALTEHIKEKGRKMENRSEETREHRNTLKTRRDQLQKEIQETNARIESNHCIRGFPSLVRWMAINITRQERMRTQNALAQPYNGHPLPTMVSMVSKVLRYVGAGTICLLEGHPTPMEVYELIKQMIEAKELDSGHYPTGDYQQSKRDNYKHARKALTALKDTAMRYQPPDDKLDNHKVCNEAMENFLLDIPWNLRRYPWKDVSRRSATVPPRASASFSSRSAEKTTARAARTCETFDSSTSVSDEQLAARAARTHDQRAHDHDEEEDVEHEHTKLSSQSRLSQSSTSTHRHHPGCCGGQYDNMFRANAASDRVLQFQLGQISMARLLHESQGTESESSTTDMTAYGDDDETEYPFNYADIAYVYQNATAPQTAPLYQATAPPPAGSSANSTRPQTRPSDHNFNLPRLQTKTDLLAGLNILRPDKPIRPNGTRWLCGRCVKAGLPEDACWHFGDDYLLCTTHWYRSELCNLPTSDPVVAQLHARLGLTPSNSTPTSTGVPTAALRTQQPRTCYLCGVFGHLAAHCEWANKCLRCGQEGHIMRDCPNPNGGGPGGRGGGGRGGFGRGGGAPGGGRGGPSGGRGKK